jgi:L-methionine (R)-S-oxide reductase
MAEELSIANGDKNEKYKALIPQLESLTAGEPDLVANLANIAAALKQTFDFFWAGFYFVKGDELVLGPFQGPIACTRIGYGKGVCGTAWKKNEPIIVDDVDTFPGHIACSSAARSEIVLPIRNNGAVAIILDIDSDQYNHFDETVTIHDHRFTDLLYRSTQKPRRRDSGCQQRC